MLARIIPDLYLNRRFRAVGPTGIMSNSFGTVKEGERALENMVGMAESDKELLRDVLPFVFLVLDQPPLTPADLLRIPL